MVHKPYGGTASCARMHDIAISYCLTACAILAHLTTQVWMACNAMIKVAHEKRVS